MVLRNSIDAERLISMARAALVGTESCARKAEEALRAILHEQGAIHHDEDGSLLTCNSDHVQFLCVSRIEHRSDSPVVTVYEDGSWERV